MSVVASHLFRARKSARMASVFPWARSEIHVSSARASLTLLFFLLECLNSRGKVTLRGTEPVQEQCQNKASFPFPRVTVVAALKSCLSLSSQGKAVPIQGLSRWVQESQSHQIRRAKLNLCRSCSPRSPISIGEHTVGQLTFHFPPVSSSSCAQRKHLRALSTSLKNLLGTFSTAIVFDMYMWLSPIWYTKLCC